MTAQKRRDLFGRGQLAQQRPHLALGGKIEPARGLVEKQHFRAAHQRPRDLDAPLHARAVGADQLAAEIGRRARRRRGASRHRRPDSAVRRMRAKYPRYSRAVHVDWLSLVSSLTSPTSGARRADRVRRRVPRARAARRRRQQRRQHPNRRRLARAVQAEKSVELALRDSQRDAVDGDEVAEPPREPRPFRSRSPSPALIAFASSGESRRRSRRTGASTRPRPSRRWRCRPARRSRRARSALRGRRRRTTRYVAVTVERIAIAADVPRVRRIERDGHAHHPAGRHVTAVGHRSARGRSDSVASRDAAAGLGERVRIGVDLAVRSRRRAARADQ